MLKFLPNSSSSDTGFDEFMDMSFYGKNDNVSCVYFPLLITKFQQYASVTVYSRD